MVFESLANELILCVWDYLCTPDLLFSFSQLNNRITHLLLAYTKGYKELDLRYGSLSACRWIYRHVVVTPEWCRSLSVLKLGNVYRCAQLEMFASEFMSSLIANGHVKGEQRCYKRNKDRFHALMERSKNVSPIFPQLTTLDVRQPISITDECRDTLLHLVANSSNMCTFNWKSSCQEIHHSKALFDWLFLCTNGRLNQCRLITTRDARGYRLSYHHTISASYQPHQSLNSLTVSILNFSSLPILLHYLPMLQNLGKIDCGVVIRPKVRSSTLFHDEYIK